MERAYAINDMAGEISQWECWSRTALRPLAIEGTAPTSRANYTYAKRGGSQQQDLCWMMHMGWKKASHRNAIRCNATAFYCRMVMRRIANFWVFALIGHRNKKPSKKSGSSISRWILTYSKGDGWKSSLHKWIDCIKWKTPCVGTSDKTKK